MRAARSLALMASRVSLRACVRTRRPVVFDGVLRVVARRADGLRAAGLRLAAGLAVEVVVFVVSAIWVFPLPVLCSGSCSLCSIRRTYVRKPKSWRGDSGLMIL